MTGSVKAKEPLWFNSGVNNRDITYSADGSLLLTTIVAPKNQFSVIAFSRRIGAEGADGSIRAEGSISAEGSNSQQDWSPLKVAPFSGEYADIEASFHPNGRWVYFASKRPKPDREGDDWDLWRVSYSRESWGEPENLGGAVNSTGNEFYPSVTNSGTLYFTATREDSLGFEDLYLSRLDNDRYTTAENVGAPVNSAAYEFNAFIAPDESYLIFGGQRRPEETGGGDLYIAHRVNGQFDEPQLLGADINSTRLDYCPYVFGDRFYFTTEFPDDAELGTVEKITNWYQSPGNGLGDIYSVPLDYILRPR
jgi:hypothetical protein